MKRTKWKRPKNLENSVFCKVVIPKVGKWKIDFWQKLPDTICVRKGEKRALSRTLSVLANNFLWPKRSNSGKTI